MNNVIIIANSYEFCPHTKKAKSVYHACLYTLSLYNTHTHIYMCVYMNLHVHHFDLYICIYKYIIMNCMHAYIHVYTYICIQNCNSLWDTCYYYCWLLWILSTQNKGKISEHLLQLMDKNITTFQVCSKNEINKSINNLGPCTATLFDMYCNLFFVEPPCTSTYLPSNLTTVRVCFLCV